MKPRRVVVTIEMTSGIPLRALIRRLRSTRKVSEDGFERGTAWPCQIHQVQANVIRSERKPKPVRLAGSDRIVRGRKGAR